MNGHEESINALHEIKDMMNRSSRFVSLSGWSGIAAGICALAGAWMANRQIAESQNDASLHTSLWVTALVTFAAAFLFAFFFTFLRSNRSGVPVWGFTARRVMINVAIPMVVGAAMVWRMAEMDYFGLLAPACLIFYGLALINASKYTLSEIRYLGYLQLVLGLINLWMPDHGLYFWAAGFGVLHILYGLLVWNKYDRNDKTGAS